jgi:biopolymer transport protein ExbD
MAGNWRNGNSVFTRFLGLYPLLLVGVLLVTVLALWVRRLDRWRLIDLQLGSSDCPVETWRPLVLELPAEGGYVFQGRGVPLLELGDTLASAYHTQVDKLLLIEASSARPYADFVQAADLARGAGVQVIGVPGPHGDRWCLTMFL